MFFLGSGLAHPKPRDSWKSEPQLAQRDVKEQSSSPQPPPRPLPNPGDTWGKHSASMNSLHHAVIVGSPISIDDWVPERPPKKPQLRALPIPSRVEVPAVPERVPSPDLPPPPPPPPPVEVVEDSPFPDEPLPPPPEAEWLLATAVPRISTPGPASPQSDPPLLSQVQGTFGSPSEQSMVLGMIVQPDEIQYDPDAINAIMECNRGAKDLQRRRPRKPREEPSSPRSHIENRPPLPLPRDAQPLGPKTNCDLDDLSWLAQYGKARKQKKTLSQALDSAPANPFIRTNKEASVRASIKMLKNEMASRMSLRSPRDKRAEPDSRPMQRAVSATESIAAMQRSVSVPDTSAALRGAPTSIARSVSVNNKETLPSIQNDAKSIGEHEVEPCALPRPKMALPSETERLRSQNPVRKQSEYDSKNPARGHGFSVFGRRMSEELAVDEPSPPVHQQSRYFFCCCYYS